jgi:hypothetical protein
LRAIGIHEDWTATPPGRTPAQVLARYPKSGIGRCFTGNPITTVQDLRPKVLSTLKPYLDAGTPVIYISIKTDIAKTRNGDFNTKYAEVGGQISGLKAEYDTDIVVIPWHEPEDNFSSGDAYVHYYNKVRDNIKLGGPDVKVKPCFTAYHWAPGAAGSIGGKTNDPSLWFTGLKMDDGAAVDVYSGRSFPLDQILPEHPGFARWVSFLPASVRISITERGWETPSSTNSTNRSALRAATEEREFNWLLSSDPTARRIDDYIIWSSPGVEGAQGLIQDAAAVAKIDAFLAAAVPDPEEQPDPESAQYQYGYAAGLTAGEAVGYAKGVPAGVLEGRTSAFTEARDWAASKITGV